MAPFLQSMTTFCFLALGVVKWFSIGALSASYWGRLALGVGAVEIVLGAFSWWHPSACSFGLMVAFAAIMILAAVFGPPLPECHCLGAFSGLTPAGRTSLSLILLALSAESLRKSHQDAEPQEVA